MPKGECLYHVAYEGGRWRVSLHKEPVDNPAMIAGNEIVTELGQEG